MNFHNRGHFHFNPLCRAICFSERIWQKRKVLPYFHPPTPTLSHFPTHPYIFTGKKGAEDPSHERLLFLSRLMIHICMKNTLKNICFLLIFHLIWLWIGLSQNKVQATILNDKFQIGYLNFSISFESSLWLWTSKALVVAVLLFCIIPSWMNNFKALLQIIWSLLYSFKNDHFSRKQ